MSKVRDRSRVEAILPVPIPNTPFQWARGVQAGRWVFATGQCGTDYKDAMAPEVLQSGHPLDGPSQSHREAKRIFQNVTDVLAAGGASPGDVVRIDQYYTSPDVGSGGNTSKARFRHRHPICIGDFRAPNRPWKSRSWPPFRARTFRSATQKTGLTKF